MTIKQTLITDSAERTANGIVFFLLLPYEVSMDTENTVYIIYKVGMPTHVLLFYHVSG